MQRQDTTMSSSSRRRDHQSSPQNNLLDVDEGESDEDDLIVYGDQSSARPMGMEPPLTQDTLQTTQSHTSCRMVINTNTTNVNLMSRQERRKRRREWRDRQQRWMEPELMISTFQDEEDDPSDDDDEEEEDEDGSPNAEKMEDTFASLQALLEERSSCSQSQQEMVSPPKVADALPFDSVAVERQSNSNANTAIDNSPRTSSPQAVEEAEVAGQHSHEPSPPDFDFHNDDDYEEEDVTESLAYEPMTTKKQSPWHTRSSTSDKNKRKRTHDRAKRARSSYPPPPHFDTIQSSLRARAKQRRDSLPSKQNDGHSLRGPTQIIQTEKTIVGMRYVFLSFHIPRWNELATNLTNSAIILSAPLTGSALL